MRKTLLLTFTTLLVLVSPAFAQSSDEKALLDADRKFSAESQKRGADAWLETMTDDTVLARAKPVVGLKAIRAELSQQFADPKFKLTWEPEEAHMVGKQIGFTRGHYVAEGVTSEGKHFKSKGQYLTVWQRQDDGSWKMLWDGGSALERVVE